MSLIRTLRKSISRALDPEKAVNDALLLDQVGASSAKLYVSEETSLKLSAVWACVRILRNSVASLPLHLYHNTGNQKTTDKNHPAYRVMANPSEFLTKFNLLGHLMVSCTLWGNGYVRIYRDNKFRPERLDLLMPWEVQPTLSENKSLFYRVSSTGELLPHYDVIHLCGLSTNGIEGKSPIAVHRENLALSVAAQEYGKLFFSQGGNTAGVLEHPGELSDAAYKRLKDSLVEKMIGLNNAHKPLLLEGGMKYSRISIPPEDAQFIATRKFQKNEIATIFGVPPHKIADLERSTNNNIEHQSIEFVSDSVLPYVVALEEQLNKKLLRDTEQGEWYFKFALEGLLRGDSTARGNFYRTMHLIGGMSPNEIREKEDLNPYAGGEHYFVQQNMQPIQKAITNDPKSK